MLWLATKSINTPFKLFLWLGFCHNIPKMFVFSALYIPFLRIAKYRLTIRGGSVKFPQIYSNPIG
jgi:hypothetical protein